MYDYLKMNDYKLSEVYPPLEKDRIEDFLEDYEKYDDINLQKHKSLDDIPEKVQKLLKQVYIGGVLKNKPAIKARFLQYKLYSDEF